MLHLPNIVMDLALILISAGIITMIFKWLKQPLVLGYIVAGLLAGPYIHIFPTVLDQKNIEIWAEIGVVFLLFALGLEFSFKKLLKVGGSAFITAMTEVVSMLIIGYFLGQLLGWSPINSIFLGGMLSMSSTTIIIKAFDDLNLNNKGFTRIVFGTLVVEDLVAILMMMLLSTMVTSQGFTGEVVLGSLVKVGFSLVLCFLVGIFVLPVLFRKAKKIINDETLLIISIGLCLGMVVLSTKVGFSAALGAFVMGSILAETVESERIEHIIKPVKDLFGAIFFVSVGMLVDPSIMVKYAGPIVIITLVTIAGKAIFSSLGVLLSGQNLNVSIQSGFSLAQIGEFAFIIASLGVSLGILADYVYPIIVAVSVITTFATPYMIRVANPFSVWLYKKIPESMLAKLERYSSGSNTINRESDWRKLLKLYATRIIIYSVVLTAILLLSFNYIVPLITGKIAGLWGSILSATLTLALMTPFLIALIANRANSLDLFMQIWNDSHFNKGRLISLILLRVFIAVFFISIVLFRLFDFQNGAIIVISVLVLLVLFLLQADLNQYEKLEKRFMANLNEREEAYRLRYPLKASFSKKLVNRDIHLSTVVIPANSPCIGKTLRELSFRKNFGVSIVKITRENQKINIPDGSEHLYPNDKVVVVGTDNQIKVFLKKIEPDQSVLLPEVKDLVLESIIITETSPLLGRSIKETRMGREFKCVLVGIERNNKPMMSPEHSTIIELDDLIWVVGERENINQLV